MEAAFTDKRGTCLLSKSAVSELTDALWTEYEAFRQRPLGDVPILALFLDGVSEPLRRDGVQRVAVLVGALIAIRDAATPAASEQAVAALLERYGREFPAACKGLSADLPARLAHHQLPWRLRKFCRTTNLCERSFVEEQRRSKTLPRFFTEQSCVKLVFATLIRATQRWQRIAITPLEHAQLQQLYQERGLNPVHPGAKSPDSREAHASETFAEKSGLDQ